MKKLSNYLFATLVMLSLASYCFSQKTLKNGDKWIPGNFDPKTTVLLIEEWDGIQKEKGITHQENYMDEKYPFKYEVVPLSVITNRQGKYANCKIYKWALVSSTNTTALNKSTGASTNTGVLTSVDRDFHFYDRENDKNYPVTDKSQGPFKQTFQVVINTIVKHIGQ